MKAICISLLAAFLCLSGAAQVKSVSLQASGLTCSMCSKAVYNALQKVSSVDKVQVDIKNQKYNITFKDGAPIEFDALSKAVIDAGFSVANFTVTAEMSGTLARDEHIQIGSQYFHFLNASGQQVNGTALFTVVDKDFTSAKSYKKYSGMSKKECVQTGRSSKCCSKDELPAETRIYHAII